MARKRMVSPELATSISTAKLPIPTRYMWVLLWTHLDDEGRCHDNADIIRAAIWPLDPQMKTKHVEQQLAQLAAADHICRYVVDEKRLLHAMNWAGDQGYQKISHPTRSKIPPCPWDELHLRDGFRKESGVLRSDSTPVEVSSSEGSSSPVDTDWRSRLRSIDGAA